MWRMFEIFDVEPLLAGENGRRVAEERFGEGVAQRADIVTASGKLTKRFGG